MLPLVCVKASVVAFALAASAFADTDAPPIVPYRPSVADPAQLPAPGYPELELGFLHVDNRSNSKTDSFPALFKVSWSENWGMLVGTNLRIRERDDDSTVISGGDTTLTLKQFIPWHEGLSFGAEYDAKMPTARPPIGSGKSDWGVTGITSIDVGEVHIDINTGALHLGNVDENQSHWQGAWAIAASHPLRDNFAITGELSGSAQRGSRPTSQVLTALTYSVNPQLTFDVAATAGINTATPRWQFTTGLVAQLGHWF